MRYGDYASLHARYEDAAKGSPPRRLEQPEFGDYPQMAVEDLKAMMDSGQPVQMLDATPKHFVARRQEMMVGAQWRDHEKLPEWIGELNKDQPVAVFCDYGFHVACR